MLKAMLRVIYETTGESDLYVFLLLTIVLGGWAAWRAGQAVAQAWLPLWPVLASAALIAAAVRFLHYALFAGPLLSPTNFLIDLSFLLVIAFAGHRTRRARHMSEQYPWLFAQAGPLAWRMRGQR
ncbi:MAG TPA: hypothetical protein VJ045_05120 [Hyphomicrobiaceae bacterium]|nr:hypothetical protein [Hyphomicrobiaceae bacterium]